MGCDGERPAWFPHSAIEHKACRNGVAVFDMTSFSKYLVQVCVCVCVCTVGENRTSALFRRSWNKSWIRVFILISLDQGEGAVAFLNTLCAKNVDVKAGTVVYTAMLNERGGYEADITVLRLGAYVCVSPSLSLSSSLSLSLSLSLSRSRSLSVRVCVSTKSVFKFTLVVNFINGKYLPQANPSS